MSRNSEWRLLRVSLRLRNRQWFQSYPWELCFLKFDCCLKYELWGFEPTRISPPELESGALDHSAKLAVDYQQTVIKNILRFHPNSSKVYLMRQDSIKYSGRWLNSWHTTCQTVIITARPPGEIFEGRIIILHDLPANSVGIRWASASRHSVRYTTGRAKNAIIFQKLPIKPIIL